MTRALLTVLCGLILALVGGIAPRSVVRAAGPFDDWAAIVVAGDFHAHSGADSEAFDNARRDVSHALVETGFSPIHMRQFSTRPDRYPAEHLMLSNPQLIESQLADVASQARGGCLIYFTSHGSPAGVVVGPRLLSPAGLSQIVDDACGARPTVVIISACFSGVFIPPMSRPDRMVLTAARPDRSSFGCGEEDRYPYFDTCMLETMPKAKDFGDLSRGVQACVAAKEVATGMSPPSEPQLFIGPQFRPLVPFYPFPPRRTAEATPLSRLRSAP